jgi:hypothetical protein
MLNPPINEKMKSYTSIWALIAYKLVKDDKKMTIKTNKQTNKWLRSAQLSSARKSSSLPFMAKFKPAMVERK